MIFGVDLDGVSSGYIDGLRQNIALARNYTPEEVEKYLPAVNNYNFSDWKDLGEDFVTFHTDAVDRGLYANLPVIDGASETLWKLSDEGHHIRVITKRFVKNGQHGRVVADTAAWLDTMNIPYRDLAFLGKKSDLHADIYIDDAPSNIAEFQENNKNYIIFDAPYNKDLQGPRAFTWAGVYSLIKHFEKEGHYLDKRLVHQ